MSDNQKNCSSLLADERIQKELSKRFDFPSYWTLEEGLRFFSPIEEEGKRFPLRRMKTSKFEKIKRDVETQKLKTISSEKEIKQIIAYDPVADREKLKTQRSALRTAKIKWRNLQHYGSIDKERKLSPSQILDEKIIFFCSNIRIKPEVLIGYIINHLDLFSPDIDPPPKLQDWLSTVKDFSTTIENKPESEPNSLQPGDSLEDRLNSLIKTVTPEIELLYEEIKAVAKANDRDTQDLRYEDGEKAFQRKGAILKLIKQEHMEKNIFGSSKPYRDIQGGILRKIIIDGIPELIKNKQRIKIDSQALQKRMNDIKKKTA
jgi:hypothetical protein